jgi:hypothetical protein
MPNLPMHIYLADQVAEQLDWGYLYDHIGSFYLGSTAPDIRAMTKWPREQTHFAPLSVSEVGTGTRTMFRNFPELLDEGAEYATTRSFLLGYICHLASDEVWITTVYRPNFDIRSQDTRLTADQVQADIWDRAVQLDMDRLSLPDVRGPMDARAAVSCGDEGVSVPFLEDGLLAQWKERVSGFVGREFEWSRLKFALNRMYRDNDEVQKVVDGFLERMPYSLDEVYERIPEAKVENYRREAVAATIALVHQFLPE